MSESRTNKRGARREGGAGEYEVGYGRPPAATRFKPGQCGNPKGRPKRPKTVDAAIECELDRTIVVRENGREKRLSKRQVAARQAVDSACRGDVRALRFIRGASGGNATNGSGPAIEQQLVAEMPLDSTDHAILAAFAAMVRGGAFLPSEAIPTGEPSTLDGEASAVGQASPLPQTWH